MRQFGYLRGSYQDARSTKHKILTIYDIVIYDIVILNLTICTGNSGHGIIVSYLTTTMMVTLCSRKAYSMMHGPWNVCFQPVFSASVFSQCFQSVLSAGVVSQCCQPVLSASVFSQCFQPVLSASVFSQCFQPVLSASVVSQCFQPVFSVSVVSRCFSQCFQPVFYFTFPHISYKADAWNVGI